MEKFVFGFWGWYFGTSIVVLAVSAYAYSRTLRRISLNSALATLVSAIFVVAFLGGLPWVNADHHARFLGILACSVAALLFYMLLSFLGVLRHRKAERGGAVALAALAALTIGISFLLKPLQAQAFGTAVALTGSLTALVLCIRSALLGDRLARGGIVGVFFVATAIAGLGWIAMSPPDAPWQLHAVTATAATGYLSTMAIALCMRYAYLIELRHVMAHGPSYDPVTRMRSHGETGRMIGEAFRLYRNDPQPLGMIVVSVANLDVLEKLYGLAAVNHALFVCAGRLRREIPEYVETGRLADDSFLLLVRNCDSSGPLLKLAHRVQACLSRPVKLNTSFEAGFIGVRQTRWVAETGVGVLRVYRPDARAAKAVALGRGMSRTAWSYPSRVAWFDEKSGEIVGMPLAPA